MYIWNEMTRGEIEELKHGLVVIPIGAIEQHGYHLPVETDNAIGGKIAMESVKKASTSIPIILGPTIPFGHSHHHYVYAGAISLSIPTLRIVIKEVVESVMKSGFNKIFILNSHGGNDEIIRLVAKELNYEHPLNIGAASYWELAKAEITAFRAGHQVYEFGHAGQFETSLMMAIKPDLVKMENLSQEKKERKAVELTLEPFVKLKASSNIWKEIDGYSDEPGKARREFGESLIDVISDKLGRDFINFYKDCL